MWQVSVLICVVVHMYLLSAIIRCAMNAFVSFPALNHTLITLQCHRRLSSIEIRQGWEPDPNVYTTR